MAWPAAYPAGGLLFYGDNKEVLATLVKDFRGKVKLIYIDPPFDSGADYVRKVQLRGVANAGALAGEEQSLLEQVQYSDIWTNDTYLQFMYERLLLLKELLADGGAIFLHCDSTKGHHLRCLMDEVFGPEKFLNEIIWSYKRWPSNTPAFQSMHDTILYYIVENRTPHTFHRAYEGASESYLKRFGGKTQKLDEETRTRKITLDDETKGMPLRDVWDLSILAGVKNERVGYPTQKPEELVERIISLCSNPGDLVLDCFIGSGTTAAVAQKLGRRWIGCDINKGAIQTTSRRLQQIIIEQGNVAAAPRQSSMDTAPEASPAPAQLSFTIHRVNDYDLAVQHNELATLVAEQLGITRLPTDGFFDGTRGANLVKIVPFDHAVGPLDLELVKDELLRRPEETRGALVVALGKELAADNWLVGWNKQRAVAKLGEDNRPVEFVNTIEIIDLRTDARHGGFIAHQPAQAEVTIVRQDEEIRVAIETVISPTIMQRLQLDLPLFQARITDWRAVVSSVEIDTCYGGEVFNIGLSDIPERKSDLVKGQYTVAAPAGATTVAVKITDMLGEEILVTREV